MSPSKNKMLKIVADDNMPHVERLFSPVAEIQRIPGRRINAKDVERADALLVRSITQVNENLLKDSCIRFVGSATIGTDHLDLTYLQRHHIKWSNAAGCNADAVSQYVISSILYWCKKEKKEFNKMSVGIIGAGNVGTSLSKYLKRLGVQYKLNDPPLELAGDSREFSTIDDILCCDVVTIHVPLIREGKFSTYHLFECNMLRRLKASQLLINAARGSVICNQSLEQLLLNEPSKAPKVVLDVFENEPSISTRLAENCLIATPHIAGHTLEGKSRGSYMIYQALCDCFGIEADIKEEVLYPPANVIDLKWLNDSWEIDNHPLLSIYDIEKDHVRFLSAKGHKIGRIFDRLRSEYPLSHGSLPRRDYSGWQLNLTEESLSENLKNYSTILTQFLPSSLAL